MANNLGLLCLWYCSLVKRIKRSVPLPPLGGTSLNHNCGQGYYIRSTKNIAIYHLFLLFYWFFCKYCFTCYVDIMCHVSGHQWWLICRTSIHCANADTTPAKNRQTHTLAAPEFFPPIFHRRMAKCRVNVPKNVHFVRLWGLSLSKRGDIFP